VALACALFVVVATGGVIDGAGGTATAQAATSASATGSVGYWMLGGDGVVYGFGAAQSSTDNVPYAMSIAPKSNGTGYWVVDAKGGVRTYGTAAYFGGTPARVAGEIVTTMSATPTGNGYWLFTNLGRAFAYGDARSYGDMSRTHLNGGIVASTATPTGRGYYMIGSDGGVFSFGDARFHGSTGGMRLNRPIVGVSATPDNRGYWLVASDGGVFAFNAPFRGSMGATPLNRPVTGLVAFGNGYLMAAADGGVFDFSNKPFLGSLSGFPLSAPITAIAAFTHGSVGVGTPTGGSGVNKGRPFSTTGPWNTPTPAGTSWFDTPTLHTLSTGGFRHWWVNTDSVGIWWSSLSDPVWTFNMPAYVAPSFHRNRPASKFTMRAPASMVAGTDVDHILVVIDPASGNYVEVWQASVNPATRTVTNIAGSPGWAKGNAITGPGAGTLSNNDGVRAANFSWAAGLITGADLRARKIDHALAVALPSAVLKGGGSTGAGAWRLPATAWDAGYWGGNLQTGTRLGIPPGVARPAGLSTLGVMAFNALQKYGAFVGDYTGGEWPLFYADNRSVTEASMCPLFCYWNYNGSSDMEKIAPLLRVAGYQP
jgi:hypothetical protein